MKATCTRLLRAAVLCVIAPGLAVPPVHARPEPDQPRCASLELPTVYALTQQELAANWRRFSSDTAWAALLEHAEAAGFSRSTNKGTAGGFRGRRQSGEDVLLCAFDLYNRKDPGRVATALWIERGSQRYQAYVVLPERALDAKTFSLEALERALEGAKEWYVDKDRKVQEAHSFRTCFARHARRDCGPICAGFVAACGAAAVGVAIATAGPTAGIGLGAAVGFFVVCAGAGCAACFALVALECA